MTPLDPSNPIYAQVYRDFNRWAKDHHTSDEGMVGQTESHFPCKSAYSIAVFDHDKKRFTSIKVMRPEGGRVEWWEVELG